MADDAPPTVEQLLADARLRPAGGWSARAEAFADASWTGWRDTFALWREERRVTVAETDAELLYAALEGERARVRELKRQLAQRDAA